MEIKRVLFSPFISAYFGFKGTNRKEQVNSEKTGKTQYLRWFTRSFLSAQNILGEGWVYGLRVHLELLVHLSYKAFLGIKKDPANVDCSTNARSYFFLLFLVQSFSVHAKKFCPLGEDWG